MADTPKTVIPGAYDLNRTLYPLNRILTDLWGSVSTGAPLTIDGTAQPDVPPLKPSPATQAPAAAVPVQAAPTPAKESFPPFDKLWQVADENVEWTDALVYAACPDGLTDAKSWSFYHGIAGRVLSGDTAAYTEVLAHGQPLNDLKPFAAAFEVSAESADKLTAVVDCNPAYMQESLPELQRYISGLALRVARDLMAILPVTEVAITCRYDGKALLEGAFTRSALRSLRFSFIDPTETVKQLGATIAELKL